MTEIEALRDELSRANRKNKKLLKRVNKLEEAVETLSLGVATSMNPKTEEVLKKDFSEAGEKADSNVGLADIRKVEPVKPLPSDKKWVPEHGDMTYWVNGLMGFHGEYFTGRRPIGGNEYPTKEDAQRAADLTKLVHALSPLEQERLSLELRMRAAADGGDVDGGYWGFRLYFDGQWSIDYHLDQYRPLEKFGWWSEEGAKQALKKYRSELVGLYPGTSL